jgi:proteasome lid subunit RPN8/RPN11
LNIPTPGAIQIRQSDLETMRLAVAGTVPEEACGLLAGTIHEDLYQVELVVPTTNILHSPVRYRMDPTEQLHALERIDAAGLELVGIYHSHPQGPDHPSPTDLAEAYYPEVVYLIWSGQHGAWECAAFRLQNGQASIVEINSLG